MPDSQPLAGLAVVNTRATHQAQPLTDALTRQGAAVFHYPAIRIVPPMNPAPLDAALASLADGAFDWLVLTSTNAVESLAQRLVELTIRNTLPDSGIAIAAVGSATAEAAARLLGVQPSLVPDEFRAESLAAVLDIQPGTRVFLPQSEIARPFLSNALTAAGAHVTQVTAYHTLTGQGGDPVPQLFWEGRIDAATFTSPSTVHNFLKRLKAEGGNGGMLVDVAVACIGPQAVDAARSHDLPVQVVPTEHTIGGLVQALCEHFQRIV